MASEATAPRLHPDGLVTFALATFNVALALLVPLLLLYRRDPEFGETLAGLGTGAGLGLFALVWVAAVWATRGALRGFPSLLTVPFDGAMIRGTAWGGRAGVLVFLALVVVLLVATLVTNFAGVSSDEGAELPVVLLYVAAIAAIGSAVACIVGAAFGAATALVDFAILLLVRQALRVAV